MSFEDKLAALKAEIEASPGLRQQLRENPFKVLKERNWDWIEAVDGLRTWTPQGEGCRTVTCWVSDVPRETAAVLNALSASAREHGSWKSLEEDKDTASSD